jgi:hypothetical protein
LIIHPNNSREFYPRLGASDHSPCPPTFSTSREATMPDIRSVCIADTHFGAEASLLTNLLIASRDTDPIKPSPVLKKLVGCLRYLIDANFTAAPKPTLILDGDILELALYRLYMYSAVRTWYHS